MAAGAAVPAGPKVRGWSADAAALNAVSGAGGAGAAPRDLDPCRTVVWTAKGRPVAARTPLCRRAEVWEEEGTDWDRRRTFPCRAWPDRRRSGWRPWLRRLAGPRVRGSPADVAALGAAPRDSDP
ncbi:hypothetical protein NDU88_005142 [Pleurodeles waltl]|uniref:Uncharacterized protein n=1 Tax=Pleurodeles waltl TaxID=8319 RepID=A0AAV7UJ02_PLEWA|nr:hypothetical protein NDU88_005142 [Pleurodeles waltl]